MVVGWGNLLWGNWQGWKLEGWWKMELDNQMLEVGNYLVVELGLLLWLDTHLVEVPGQLMLLGIHLMVEQEQMQLGTQMEVQVRVLLDNPLMKVLLMGIQLKEEQWWRMWQGIHL